MKLPADWTSDRASGWWELHHLVDGPATCAAWPTGPAQYLHDGPRERPDFAVVFDDGGGEDEAAGLVDVEPLQLDDGVPMIYRVREGKIQLAFDPRQIREADALRALRLTLPYMSADPLSVHHVSV